MQLPWHGQDLQGLLAELDKRVEAKRPPTRRSLQCYLAITSYADAGTMEVLNNPSRMSDDKLATILGLALALGLRYPKEPITHKTRLSSGGPLFVHSNLKFATPKNQLHAKHGFPAVARSVFIGTCNIPTTRNQLHTKHGFTHNYTHLHTIYTHPAGYPHTGTSV